MANPAPLLQQITRNPLLIDAAARDLFQASIEHIVGHEHSRELLAAADDDFWPTDPNDWRAAYRPYNVRSGVLQIPVNGVLLNKFGYQAGRWATGYTYIEKALERGMADSNVKAIAFVIDSPGGEVAGCFELSDKIYEARGEKPMRAFASDHAYSAAYSIASAVGDITLTRSGGVGSIGVVTAHMEMSEALKQMGVKVTFIYAGAHKVDGNPYEKLPENVKARIQSRIDRIYGVFTAAVARNRDMDEKAVRDTKALTYDASDAVDVGLADRVGAFEEELAAFAAATEEKHMATTPTPTVDQATHDAAVASATSAGQAAGAAAEKTRVKAILASDEGKKRPKAAFSCAMNTDLSLDAARAFLAELPEEKAETPAPAPAPTSQTPFDKAMELSGNPNVGSNPGKEDDGDDDAKATASILSAYTGMTGFKKKVA